MPDAAAAGAAAPDPRVETVPGWAQQLLDAGVDPDVVRAAVAKDAEDSAGPPPSDEQRAQAAEAMRGQAEEDLSNALASAQATKAHGESLLEAAEGQLAKAQADYDQAMATADEIDPAPPWAEPGAPGGGGMLWPGRTARSSGSGSRTASRPPRRSWASGTAPTCTRRRCSTTPSPRTTRSRRRTPRSTRASGSRPATRSPTRPTGWPAAGPSPAPAPAAATPPRRT